MTKRLVAAIIAALMLIISLLTLSPNSIVDALTRYTIKNVYIYCQYSPDGVSNGVYTVVQSDKFNYRQLYSNCYNIGGMTVVISDYDVGVEDIIKDFDIAIVQYDQQLDCYYGYSQYIVGGIIVDNCYVNIQLAQREDCLLIGYPIILGSY